MRTLLFALPDLQPEAERGRKAMNLDDWHEQAGREAYAAFNKTRVYKTVAFDDLNELDQEAWRGVARAVLAEGKIEVRPSAELAEAATREENERLAEIATNAIDDVGAAREVVAELRKQVRQYERSADEHVQKFERKHEQLRETERERDMYRDLAEQLYQDDACSFDHHGGCQAHGWLEPEPGEECPDGRAQRLFAKKDKTDDDVRACTSCGSCSYCRKKVGNGEA